MRARALSRLPAVLLALWGGPATAWDWDGEPWADYRAFLGPVTPAMKLHLHSIAASGEASGRVEGRLGQIGDSITETFAYLRGTMLYGPTNNETGHDYDPIRSWLAYSGSQPADAQSFYRDHGKGPLWGNQGGWQVTDAVAAGHPAQGVLVGDGQTAGQYSWALVMYGTNDIDSVTWDPLAWKEEVRAFVLGYAALGVVPVLSTIPPELAHLGDGRVEEANQAILQVANEEWIPWVDFHGLVLYHQPVNWLGTLISGDGTHPTSATGGRGFSQVAQTSTDGYALRTKLTLDMGEKLREIVWEDGEPDPATEAPSRPLERVLLQVAPNPFTTSTAVSFAPGGTLMIADVAGRRVRSLPAESGAARWDGTDDGGRPVPAGVYWLIARDDSNSAARMVVRLR